MEQILIVSKKQLLTLLTLILFIMSYAQKKPKILISVDMEGLAGVVTEQQLVQQVLNTIDLENS